MDHLLPSVSAIVRELAPPDQAHALTDPDLPLAQHGFDSLNLVSLLVTVERALAVEFPAEMINAETFRSTRTLAAAAGALLR